MRICMTPGRPAALCQGRERVLAWGDGSCAGARAPGLRRRQPLLRGARRVHPPPARRAWGPAACSGPRSRASKYHVVGGKVSRAVANATFNPISKPGCLSEYFRGNPNNVDVARAAQGQRADPAPSTSSPWPAPRCSTSRASPAASCTRRSGCSTRRSSRTTPRPCASRSGPSTAGCSRTGASTTRAASSTRRTSTLADVDWAVEELEWALDHGARLIVMRTAAPTTALGRQNPFDPMFDPFWARVNEAGITVVVHAGDSGRSSQRLRRRRVRGELQGRRLRPVASRASTSSRPSTTTCCR